MSAKRRLERAKQKEEKGTIPRNERVVGGTKLNDRFKNEQGVPARAKPKVHTRKGRFFGTS